MCPKRVEATLLSLIEFAAPKAGLPTILGALRSIPICGHLHPAGYAEPVCHAIDDNFKQRCGDSERLLWLWHCRDRSFAHQAGSVVAQSVPASDLQPQGWRCSTRVQDLGGGIVALGLKPVAMEDGDLANQMSIGPCSVFNVSHLSLALFLKRAEERAQALKEVKPS